MFIEMLDLLRCTNAHEDTWLVASLKAVSNRFVLDATLGCPVCHAQYVIRKGIADFHHGGDSAPMLAQRSHIAGTNEELALRIGAFLNVTEPGATVVLGGSWADAAQELSVMTETRVLTLNATKGIEESETVGLLRVNREIPLAPGSVLGVALDDSFPLQTFSAAAKVVRPGGRVVGPASIAVPSEVAVLARDTSYWVAEKPAEMVSLQRGKTPD
jgi:hypothetical protein